MPLVPSGVVGVAGDASVSLEWDGVVGADGYRVYRSTSGGAVSLVAEVAVPGFVDAAVVNGTAYGYAVSAFGAGGESAVSSSVVVTPVAPEPEPEPEVPLVPSGVVGVGW